MSFNRPILRNSYHGIICPWCVVVDYAVDADEGIVLGHPVKRGLVLQTEDKVEVVVNLVHQKLVHLLILCLAEQGHEGVLMVSIQKLLPLVVGDQVPTEVGVRYVKLEIKTFMTVQCIMYMCGKLPYLNP